jgi:hypothetical protein
VACWKSCAQAKVIIYMPQGFLSNVLLQFFLLRHSYSCIIFFDFSVIIMSTKRKSEYDKK